MSNKEIYISRRLMELACIAATRNLDDVEKREEVRLSAELNKAKMAQ